MGYDTVYTGALTIEPPLTREEFQHVKDLIAEREVAQKGEDDTDNGWRITADAIETVEPVLRHFRAATWLHWLLTETLLKDHQIDGEVDAQGDDDHDHWRMRVLDTKLRVYQLIIREALIPLEEFNFYLI
jgi:hypothetical protein